MKIKKNGKVIKLTESDLKKIVKKVLVSEAVASDVGFIVTGSDPQSSTGGGRNYNVSNVKDVLRGSVMLKTATKITPYNKKQKLEIYSMNLKSPFPGCKAAPRSTGSYTSVGDGIASVPMEASGTGNAKFRASYQLSPECKKGILMEQQKNGKGKQVNVGKATMDTAGGDVDFDIVFNGTMRDLGSKTDM